MKVPPLILGNIYPFSSLEPAVQKGVRITVASLESARNCDRTGARLGRKVYAHAKIDTGMHRIGVNAKNALAFVKQLASFKHIALEGIYTHFSGSSEDPAFTRKQLALFTEFIASARAAGVRPPLVHCANSGAILKYPDSRFTLVRPGISLYGISPVPSETRVALLPVLSWKSRIVFLKDVPAGTPVSYAGTFVTKRPSRIATAAFGYADGYRRSLSNKGQVLVRGKRVPVIGRVTMDMTMLDVTDVPGTDVGDEVVMLGRQGQDAIRAQELAAWLETSPYETFCGISARVPRVDLR